MHWELSEEIERLEEGIDFYAKELESDRQKLHLLQSDPEHLEKFAREEYWLCREGEEVFLVELTADPDQYKSDKKKKPLESSLSCSSVKVLSLS